MRRIWIISLTLFLLTATCNLSASHAFSRTLPFPSAPSHSLSLSLTPANTAFAGDIFATLQKQTTGNFLFSPYSLSTALTMTWSGTAGQTHSEMAQVLHFTDKESSIHRQIRLQADALDHRRGNNTLEVANTLWIQKDFPLEAEFQKCMEQEYQNSVHTLDFIQNADDSRTTINQWVKQHTAGQIPSLLQSADITPTTRLVLTNAIYFKGLWEKPFQPQATSLQPFYLSDGTTTSVPTMHQRGQFAYGEIEQGQFLELPYVGGDLSLLLFLPAQNQPVTVPDLTKAHEGDLLHKQTVAVALPKFNFENRFSLADTLKKMGMQSLFSPDLADLSRMSPVPKLYVGKVIHQARIEVSEEGTQASAATAVNVMLRVSLESTQFQANRPFLFWIRSQSTGAILFAGQVENPVLTQ